MLLSAYDELTTDNLTLQFKVYSALQVRNWNLHVRSEGCRPLCVPLNQLRSLIAGKLSVDPTFLQNARLLKTSTVPWVLVRASPQIFVAYFKPGGAEVDEFHGCSLPSTLRTCEECIVVCRKYAARL